MHQLPMSKSRDKYMEGIKLDIKVQTLESPHIDGINTITKTSQIERQFFVIKERCENLKEEIASVEREKTEIVKEKNAIICSVRG